MSPNWKTTGRLICLKKKTKTEGVAKSPIFVIPAQAGIRILLENMAFNSIIMVRELLLPKLDALAKTIEMAKQKFRPTRLGGFSGAKAYIGYVKVLRNHRNAKGRLFATPSSLNLSRKLPAWRQSSPQIALP